MPTEKWLDYCRTQTCIARQWGNFLRRLGESSRRMAAAAGSGYEMLAGTLVAGISRRSTKDYRLWIFPYCFSNWESRSG